ncbi:biosynthetic-type acetolactate synthase large subunit [Evansella sp. AB-P1]|uniref:biosynthetic-type acetolactate synthase large subunit n=1 Tax=Evansella sp. AB-P1 TaxID=3037653 RepID=UPI00241F819F|nr:biosynthetic-type acetolactate synthase large subunit [Evansella sp. AB-P1]MDG5787182.1 biosynthetic-type acetolactate synthase large subunit [Evansella sp. AB-P1]
MKRLITTESETILSGSELLLEAISQEERTIFMGQPSYSLIPLFDEIYKSQANTEIIHTLHEQATVHAADGFARVTGRPGVAIIPAGPGLTNAITGLATAYMDSVPLVVITAQVATSELGKDSFQEVDINGMTTSVAKHSFLVRNISEIPQMVKDAFYLAKAGRPGPIIIVLPKDKMIEKIGATTLINNSIIHKKLNNITIPDSILTHSFNEITSAKKPVLLIGGGVISSGATKYLKEFVNKTNIPVTSTLMGLSAYPSDDPLHLGMVGMHGTVAANKAIHQADLLLVLGVRFSDRVTGRINAFSPQSKKIHVEIDAAEINKIIPVDYPVVGDIKEFLYFMNENWNKEIDNVWVNKTLTWLKDSPQYNRSSSTLKPQDVIQLLSTATDGEAIVVTDVGQHQIWTAHNYTFKQSRSLLTSGGLGTMGYGLPAAIGAAASDKSRPVICISGDGGIQMNIQELLTCSKYDLPIKLVIMNNGYLGMVRQWQELFYNRRYSQVKISSPNFCSLGEAYGIKSYNASTYEDAMGVISEAFATLEPTVMEFNVKEEENVFPIVPPGGSNQEAMFEKS